MFAVINHSSSVVNKKMSKILNKIRIKITFILLYFSNRPVKPYYMRVCFLNILLRYRILLFYFK